MRTQRRYKQIKRKNETEKGGRYMKHNQGQNKKKHKIKTYIKNTGDVNKQNATKTTKHKTTQKTKTKHTTTTKQTTQKENEMQRGTQHTNKTTKKQNKQLKQNKNKLENETKN